VRLGAGATACTYLLPTLLAGYRKRWPGVVLRVREAFTDELEAMVAAGDRAVALNKRMAPADAVGESIGIERIDAAMAPHLWAELRAMIAAGETDEYYERAYERLMDKGHGFGWADVSHCLWFEIDDAADLERANALVADRP
ncbi:MAG TPA: LysR substrate-binding domain-containing protein, partial [Kofleriaceae bacterium]|nr:LysR substrate-binding domain-containing protein [Kofleriaceae bacterium]